MRPDGPRDPVAGPDSGPEPPFPIKLSGPVIAGFGRGSKELGIPTANIPPAGLSAYPDLPTGVYYGLVGLELPAASSQPNNTGQTAQPPPPDSFSSSSPSSSTTTSAHPKTRTIYQAVLSIGYNPFYKNTVRSIEIHILASFAADFYGAPLNLLVLGFIRPEYDYVSKESLIDDIRTDCHVAHASLGREAYKRVGAEEAGDGDGRAWLLDFAWVEGESAKKEKKKKTKEGGVEGEGGEAEAEAHI